MVNHNQYYIFSNEIEYIINNYKKWEILDIRDKFGFFKDIKEIKKINKDLSTAILMLKRIIKTVGKFFIFSYVILAIIKATDGDVDYLITVIVGFLYFSIGYYYLKI